MRLGFQISTICLSATLLIFLNVKSGAFALLGPGEPWIQMTNGIIFPNDIGGPMCISNGYRWNVPVVTYGFDQSFLDYFGSNGVAAVKSAIQVLNDLPPASQIALTNFPFYSQVPNFAAEAQGLNDLKSQCLSLLLEHLGLAQPTRYTYVLKQWSPAFIPAPPNYDQGEQLNWAAWAIPDYIVQLNFDPQTLVPTPYVNQNLYVSELICDGTQNYMEIFSVNPVSSYAYSSVTDFNLNTGYFYSGLTYDDVGGLKYLFSTNNVNYETLLLDVVGAGANANSFVNGAWRPGVDKVTFIPQPVDSQSGAFVPSTNYFIDRYLTNGIYEQQQMVRIISRPDFLFKAGLKSFRTGATNWINNAALNNNSSGSGPGIIQPPVVITFQKTGENFYSASLSSGSVVWSEDSVQDIGSTIFGSFDGSTNAAITYPIPQFGNVSMVFQAMLWHSNIAPASFKTFEWSLASEAGTVYAFQTSTNLSTWNTLFELTNNGSLSTYQNVNANSPTRFYRLIPQ